MAEPQIRIARPHEQQPPTEGGAAARRRFRRRRGHDADDLYADLPVRAGRPFVAWRLAYLLASAVRLAFGLALARLRHLGRRLFGRDAAPVDLQRKQARLLRRTLQRMGGTWVKIGQQMSLRTDILPDVYCRELESLLDSGEALDPRYVARVLRRAVGGDLALAFRMPFDFEAVGKASVACVYHAELLDGTPVAVKVRRPDVRRIFDADLKALDWLLRLAEFLTVLRPGISATFRSELRRMLMDELDFRAERRYQELFRRNFKRRKKLRITSPRIEHDLCTHEVIVSEYVTGIWMKELLQLVADDDRERLAELAEQGIKPKSIARRLIRGNHYQFFECPFFHGDPHPANILVQPGGRIVMIDFGACGVFGVRERVFLRQMHEAQARADVATMVSRVIQLMQPLPPIDVDTFRHELEHEWWLGYYGIISKHSGWQERTSFRLWRALLRLVRKHRVPLPLSVLRMIRATLLYDTVGARLYPRLDVFKEYRKYLRKQAKRTRSKLQRAFLRQAFFGPDLERYVVLDRVLETSRAAFEKLENFANEPVWRFGARIEKTFATLHILLKWFLGSALLTALGTVGLFVIRRVKLAQAPAGSRAELTLSSWWQSEMSETLFDLQLFDVWSVIAPWALLMALVAIKYIRQLFFRITDYDN